MTTKDLYADLQRIATQAGPISETKADGIDDVMADYDTRRVQDITNIANNMYPEDLKAKFSFWKSKLDSSTLAPKAKEVYWKTYETMHPEGKVGAKRDFVDITKRELEVISGLSGKEFFLRERLTNTPAWARKELDPILGELSAIVANSNYSKSQQVYMQDLDARIGKFMVSADLDPDIPSETHTADAVRLEQLNLMSLGKVQQGRLGVYNEKGVFFPAFGIKDRKEIFANETAGSPSIQEQSVIRDLSPNIIRKAVEGNLAVRRNKIQAQERTSTTVASKYLREGVFNMEKWDVAFSMLPETTIQDKIKMGLQGEISSGRIKSEKELVRSIYQTMAKYGPLMEPTEPPMETK